METDILIVGSGVAGLYCALNLPKEKKITIVTKNKARRSDSYLAQGGICVLRDEKDYDAFYDEEILYRKVGLYPPFCDIVCVAFWSENEKTAVQSAREYSKKFAETAKQNHPTLPLRLLGPAECSPYKVAGRYRVRLLIKCRTGKETRELFSEMQSWYLTQKDAASITLDFYYDSNM